MTTPSWSTMWTPRMGSLWRVICSRGPVMPSKHGTGWCKRKKNPIALLPYSDWISLSEGCL